MLTSLHPIDDDDAGHEMRPLTSHQRAFRRAHTLRALFLNITRNYESSDEDDDEGKKDNNYINNNNIKGASSADLSIPVTVTDLKGRHPPLSASSVRHQGPLPSSKAPPLLEIP
jgi:hypothetical protein